MVIIPCNFRHPGSGEMHSLSPLAKGVAECGKETNTRFCIFLRAIKESQRLVNVFIVILLRNVCPLQNSVIPLLHLSCQQRSYAIATP